MRSLVVNRMNVITRPATSRFDFSRLQGSQFDQIVIAGKEENKKDWDRIRYRRKQAHFAYEKYLTVCIRIIQDADGFLFIDYLGCQLSWEFDSLSRYQTISLTDRILRYERRDIGSTPIWSTKEQMLLFNNNIEWEKIGTSLTRLWVQYNGQYISLPN